MFGSDEGSGRRDPMTMSTLCRVAIGIIRLRLVSRGSDETMRVLRAAVIATAVAIGTAVAAVAALPSAALAAPAPFEGIAVRCAERGETVLTAPGEGAFTPGFFLGGNDLLVPYSVTYTVTSEAGTSSGVSVKSAPVPVDSITCTFDDTFTFDGVSYRLAGSITGVVRGQP
jgi:hypothetical protein